MKIQMDEKLARAAATDAGCKSAKSRGLTKWDKEAVLDASDCYHKLCRQFKIGLFGNIPMMPAREGR